MPLSVADHQSRPQAESPAENLTWDRILELGPYREAATMKRSHRHASAKRHRLPVQHIVKLADTREARRKVGGPKSKSRRQATRFVFLCSELSSL